MSESGSSKWIVIGCVGVALLGLCCVGGGTVAGFAYVQRMEEEAARQALLARERALAEAEEARRYAEEAEEARRAMEERRAAVPLPVPLDVVPERTSDRRPRRIEATVTRAEGASGVAVGDSCEFAVTVHDRETPVGYWCRALVECEGIPLYGEDRPDGTGNGYFGCAIWRRPRGVAGEDRETTSEGSDPFFQIDTRARRFVVIDDAESTLRPGAYTVEAAIERVR